MNSSGNIELAAQMFVDFLNAPGAWATRTPARRQRSFDNLGIGGQMSVAADTSCEQIAKFDFPILTDQAECSFSGTDFYARSIAGEAGPRNVA
jgi:hypothetical protein